jgi:hypothetical protein
MKKLLIITRQTLLVLAGALAIGVVLSALFFGLYLLVGWKCAFAIYALAIIASIAYTNYKYYDR